MKGHIHKENIARLCDEIKQNSKDERLADKILFELLSEQRQDCHIKLQVADMGEELARLEEKNFYIAKYEKGVIYHIYNSIYLVVPLSMTSLYETLTDIIDNKDYYDGLSGEERESYESYFSALAFILACPTYIFNDIELMFTVASKLVEYHNRIFEEATKRELQEETIEKDEEFKDVALAIERIKEEVSEL